MGTENIREGKERRKEQRRTEEGERRGEYLIGKREKNI